MSINTDAKKLTVEEIKDKLSRAKSVVIISARGLTVEQDTDLRRKFRAAGVDYKIYKNTLVHRAIDEYAGENEASGYSGLKDFLAGPSAFAFSYNDPTAAAHLISGELKAKPKLEFKAGLVDNIVYDSDGIRQIADIPSRDVLLGRLLGSFKSPLSSFARLVSEVAKSKESAAV